MIRVGDIAAPCKLTLRGLFANSEVAGWRLGDWAAHRQLAHPDLWCLTHMPTALSLPLVWASFERLPDAVAAMRTIARLKNSWARVTQADFTIELGARIRDICERHHAIAGPLQWAQDANKSVLGLNSTRRWNDYQEAP